MKHDNILKPFGKIASKNPNLIALSVDGCDYTYGELLLKVQTIAGWINLNTLSSSKRVGILSSREFNGFAAVYACVWGGFTFVPLNPKLPVTRLKKIIQRANLGAVVYDENCSEIFNDISCEKNYLPAFCLNNEIVSDKNSEEMPVIEPVDVEETQGAYLMFTSGTTGEPKGILATVKNLSHYLAFMQRRYNIKTNDRLSQVFELSFDAATFDLFMSVNHGASFHVVPESQLLAPGLFIKDKKLTLWFGVPSHIAYMDKMRILKPGIFPELRISIFGGEPLSVSSMKAWRLAAHNSIMDNVYGPTEATVTCFVQRCDELTPITSERSVMSIGQPYTGMYGAIVDQSASFLPSGTKGELVIAGPQLTSGYWQDERLTGLRFRVLDHPKFGRHRWYFTGDWAYEDENDTFHHLGRMDNQIKLSGHRVELEEIDAALKEASGSEIVASVAWPMEQGSARGIVAFICDSKRDLAVIREKMLDILPQYMVPRRFILSESLPYTLNGKVDRKLLAEKLEKEVKH